MRNLFLIAGLMTSCGLAPINTMGKNTDDTAEDIPEGAIMLGDLAMTPSDMDFGTIKIGENLSSDVTLLNTGSEDVGVAHMYLEGDAVFNLLVTDVTFDIPPGDEELISIDFAPDAESSFAGSFHVLINSESDIGMVSLQGSGSLDGEADADTDTDTDTDTDADTDTDDPSGDISLSKYSHDFGQVTLNSTSMANISVTNESNQNVAITGISSSDSNFSYSAYSDILPGEVISAGLTRSLTVSFTPDQEQSYSGVITLENDSANTSSIDISLSGEGTCATCAPNISVVTGGTAADTMDQFDWLSFPNTHSFMIQNNGDEPLLVTDIILTNDTAPYNDLICGDAAAYTLGSGTSHTIAPYDNVSISVTLAGTGSGATGFCGEDSNYYSFDPSDYQNTIQIISNDPDTPTHVFRLGGLALL